MASRTSEGQASVSVDAFVRPQLPLSRKQLRSIVQSRSRVNLWTGAIRSGKTIASLLRWLIFVAQAPPGGELIMVGRTRESLARNVFSALQDPSLFGPIAKLCNYTAGAAFGYILGRKIWVFGASDSRAEAILRGMTVAGAYGDEMTLWSEDLWKTLLGRMSVPGAMFFGTTNPDNPGHWLKASDRGVDHAAELGWRHFHFQLEDNQWLLDNNPEYVAQIKREYTGLYYRRFILGDWVQAEGAVYDMWDLQRHVVAHDQLPAMDRLLTVGIDYGTTNPTRGLELGMGVSPATGRPQLYVVDEWAPQRATDAGLSASFRAWRDALEPASWRRPEWVHLDPAAASFRLQLFQDGVANVAGAHNDVQPGIRTVASLLATGQLQVSDRCTKLIKYLPGYSWDPKATLRGVDQVLKVDDHEVDALRYAVHSTRALWRDRIPLTAAAVGAPGADELPGAA